MTNMVAHGEKVVSVRGYSHIRDTTHRCLGRSAVDAGCCHFISEDSSYDGPYWRASCIGSRTCTEGGRAWETEWRAVQIRHARSRGGNLDVASAVLAALVGGCSVVDHRVRMVHSYFDASVGGENVHSHPHRRNQELRVHVLRASF